MIKEMQQNFVKKGNFMLLKGMSGKGEAILTLDIAIEWIKKLNKEYPELEHTYHQDEWSGLYFIKYRNRNDIDKKVINIII